MARKVKSIEELKAKGTKKSIAELTSLMDVNRNTIIRWKKHAAFPGVDASYDELKEFQAGLQDGGNKSKEPQEEGSLAYQRLVNQNRKLELECKKIEQHLFEKKSDILHEAQQQLRNEMLKIHEELITFLKDDQSYDGAELKSLLNDALQALKDKIKEEK